jgi:ribosomal protein S12 methylthiotransferase
VSTENAEKTVGLISLGCSKNLVDSEVMLGLLQGAAVEESLQTLSDVAARKANGRCRAVVATGCLPQRDAQLIKMRVPEVDAILGSADFKGIVDAVDGALDGGSKKSDGFIPLTSIGGPSNGNGLIQLTVTPTKAHTYVYDHTTPRVRATPPWTAYLKIAEGCDHTCSFCIIPQLRGPFRSRPIESIVTEARQLAASGAKEVVLVAQDSTRYGMDLYQKWSLGTLLKELSAIEELKWVRVLYAYPSQVNDEFIEALTTAPRVARYLDIPLQHASREVLARMRRGGHAESYGRLLDRFRAGAPEIGIRTSFIVGFPGETDEQFKELCDFVKSQKFDRIGVFKYSDENSSLSYGLDGKVPQEVIEERYHTLQALQQKVSLQKNRGFIGRTIDVLIESEEPGGYVGRGERDAPDVDGNVFVKMTPRERKAHKPGEFLRVKITGCNEYDLSGKLA